MTTTHRQDSTTRPIREQILDALADKAANMVSGDGYFYDYVFAGIADWDVLQDFHARKWGDSILILDGQERPDIDETGVENWILDVDLHLLVKDETGAARKSVVARVMADAVKLVGAFVTAQNGVLVGPVRITDKSQADHSAGGIVVTISLDIWYQHADMDACSLS